MKKNSIALHFRSFDYASMAVFAQTVHDGFAASIVYTTPPVSLVDQQLAINALKAAIAEWGPRGNRGSTLSLQLLRDALEEVKANLKKLAFYCMMVTPGDVGAWSAAGFVTAKHKTKSITLQPVRNLHQFFARNLPRTFIKLRWARPMEALKHENIIYKILRSDDANIENAVHIGTVMKTTFMDQPPQTGVHFFYWVMPVNTSGNGVISEICAAVALPV